MVPSDFVVVLNYNILEFFPFEIINEPELDSVYFNNLLLFMNFIH